jgi:hypothetical protein
MAKDKKGFILYADQKALFDQLPNEKAGELIKFIMAYVNDEDPLTDDLIINLAFTPIKQQLKRDLQKFEETKIKRSNAGKAGADKRWQPLANDSKRIQTIAKIADNVNDNVNVSVNDNDNVILLEKETKELNNNTSILLFNNRKNKFKESIKPFVLIFGKDMCNDFFAYWTEPNKSKTKMKFEMQKTWDVNLRLSKWNSNNFNQKNKPGNGINTAKQTMDERLAAAVERLNNESNKQMQGVGGSTEPFSSFDVI